ncbi:hypothetical protein [uncultured Rhodoblastus sp.]|uniref:hypothetical protein n=1 Tax=uncultured Rhodoblastus sp. TaxID=543037 RepID=UPI0025D5CEA9|nr:hypothetical protein [uncultured Rhodoblastus sp.]
MTSRRGNKSSYAKAATGVDLLSFNDEQLALAWAAARRRDPMDGHYDNLRRDKTLDESVNCRDLINALGFLHEATKDVRFQDAVTALDQFGFTKGAVRQSVLAKLRDDGFMPAAFGIGAFKMHAWVKKEGMPKTRAARLVAAQYGLPCKDNDAVRCYNQAYAEYMSELTKRVQYNCNAALNSDFAPVYDDGLSPNDKSELETLYKEKVEPLIAAVVREFKSVTKDLQEKYRILSEKIAREKAAETF